MSRAMRGRRNTIISRMEWRPFQYLSPEEFQRLPLEEKCAYLRVALVQLVRTRALLRREAARAFVPEERASEH
jgi:hypothetical protein